LTAEFSAFNQVLVIVILAGAMFAFATTRWRAEIIAISALAIGALSGVVDQSAIFRGFSDPAVITVIEILMLAQLVARSGLIDHYTRPVLAAINTEQQLVLFLIVAGASISAFMNNIGALVIMMPVAYSGCRRLNISPRRVLMPLSFATLLGGMCSLIGTPANLVVSSARQETLGAPLDFFSFAIAGVPAAAAGLALIAALHQLRFALSKRMDIQSRVKSPTDESVVFEMQISEQSEWAGRSLFEIERDEDVRVIHVIRDEQFVFAQRAKIRIFVGDTLVLSSNHDRFDRLFDEGAVAPGFDSKTFVQDAVVTPSSVLLGSTVGSALPFETHDVRLVAIRGGDIRADGRFADVRISLGDVIVLAGDRSSISASLENIGCLALAPRRKATPGAVAPVSAIALACGVGLAAFSILPPETAFGIALLIAAIFGGASLPDLLRRLDWRVIILLAALIPLGGAFQESGAAAQIVQPVLAIAHSNELAVIAAIWVTATLITPFLNNVATADGADRYRGSENLRNKP